MNPLHNVISITPDDVRQDAEGHSHLHSVNAKIAAQEASFTSTIDPHVMPFNVEAEQALLGAILLNNYTYENVSDFLLPDHFSQRVHGLIFKCIGLCLDQGRLANPVTIKDMLSLDPDFQALGGYHYLIELTDINYQTLLVADYGRLIHDLHLRRQLIAIGQDTMLDARIIDGEKQALSLIEDTERRLYQLTSSGTISSGAMSFNDALAQAIISAEAAYKRDSHVVGVTTGLIDIDKYLGGLHPSDLLILAGRPSMGKTALATNIAFNAARIFHDKKSEGAPVLFFSLEMSAEQLANRILSTESSISSDSIRKGSIRAEDFPKLVDVGRRLSEVPLFIDDTPALSIGAIRNRARRMQRQHGIGLIVIDYLQLLTGSGGRHNGDVNRVQEISEITRGLKALAKELNVPVLALSQLSRAVEQREDKRPQLSDLRESGSIEQDADVVMFVYREEYYLARQEPTAGSDKHREWLAELDNKQCANMAEVIISKQRHGPVGIVKLFFDSKLTKFGNLSPNDSHRTT